LDPFHLALYYGHWVKSEPFDLGLVIKNGIEPLGSCLSKPDPNLANHAARFDEGLSLSNASLMRITPFAVWSRNLPILEMEESVRVDVSMMHSRMDVKDVCSAYCIAIRTLINNAEDRNRA